MDHELFWFAGELDEDHFPDGFLVPEAHFSTDENEALNEMVFGQQRRPKEATERIHSQAQRIKTALYDFVDQKKIEVLVLQNIMAIPMQIPLGVATTEFIAETGLPAIAHHHDFYWERSRFFPNAVPDYLQMSFPADLPSITHVAINTPASKDLASKRGIPSVVVPNVMNYEAPPSNDGETYAKAFRDYLKVADDDIVLLQPTRVIPRKGITLSIELAARLGKKAKLIITHAAGDEGMDYLNMLAEQADRLGVDMRCVDERIHVERGTGPEGEQLFSLDDAYNACDFVCYPSIYEGFGNALLETFYFKKPVMVNRYAVYRSDIEPIGFDLTSIDRAITQQTVTDVRRYIEDKEHCQKAVERNYELAKNFFGYETLEKKLSAILQHSKFGRRIR